MQPTALLCWEAGSGYGHATALITIARRLQSRNWKTILAVPNGQLPADLAAEGMTVVSAPKWGEGAEPLQRHTLSTASFGDTLAQIGLQSSEWVRRQISRWRLIFAEQRPQLVIADYAPGAILAARDRIPCIVSGVGFTVPPGGLPRYPRLYHSTAAAYDETEVCTSINSALADHGARPISGLPELMAGDAQCVCTMPILDPYDGLRAQPVIGPILNEPIARRGPEANELFCYLREAPGSDRLSEIATCLGKLSGPVVAFVPGLQVETAHSLRRRGVRLLERLPSLAPQLQRSRLVVHFGGHGTSAAALLAGVPQVILDFDVEKFLIARALVKTAVARRCDYHQTGADVIVAAIESALQDDSQIARADAVSRNFEAYGNRDPASEIAAISEQLAA